MKYSAQYHVFPATFSVVSRKVGYLLDSVLLSVDLVLIVWCFLFEDGAGLIIIQAVYCTEVCHYIIDHLERKKTCKNKSMFSSTLLQLRASDYKYLITEMALNVHKNPSPCDTRFQIANISTHLQSIPSNVIETRAQFFVILSLTVDCTQQLAHGGNAVRGAWGGAVEAQGCAGGTLLLPSRSLLSLPLPPAPPPPYARLRGIFLLVFTKKKFYTESIYKLVFVPKKIYY